MRLFLSGNEAIAFGLIEAGVRFITGYPGTPSSEVLPTAAQIKRRFDINGYFEWSINEKVALEEATAASYCGIASASVMKQVGLNVAMDPFMNTAMVGTKGGFVLVVADDPGPHSSQTEQDSRFLAFFAKVPVLEPSTPKEAYIFSKEAVILSKKYKIPIMLRTTTRVSHSREDVDIGQIKNIQMDVNFERDVDRYAATPHFRYILHKELNKKIRTIKKEWEPEEYFDGEVLVITSGISFAYLYDIVHEARLKDKLKLLRVKMPFPLDERKLQSYIDAFDDVFILEEGYPVIEMQVIDRKKVNGKLNGFVPMEGELTIDVIKSILSESGVLKGLEVYKPSKPPFKRPSLCPGCGHRSAFFAIKDIFKKEAIYTGDIGCYTLGLNLEAVDTVHCMGASVSFAFGFDVAYSLASKDSIVVATIGDSTFFHSGIAPLIDAVHNRSKFILVILDNATVAMTGNQTTPANDFGQTIENANPVEIERIIKAIGVGFLKTRDAYDIEGMKGDLREAKAYVEKSKAPAVLIFRHPCVYTKEGFQKNIKFDDVYVDKGVCTGCRICISKFECPSLVFVERDKKVVIDVTTCIKCGQCVSSCPFNAIVVVR